MKTSTFKTDLLKELRRLFSLILGSCLTTLIAASPAHAQMAQSSMMAYSLIRTVPMMGNMLVRGLKPHSGQDGNKKNNNTNNVHGQMQSQSYIGTAPTGSTMGQVGYPVMQSSGSAALSGTPGYGMQGQAYAAPTMQQGYQAVPGLSYAAPTAQGGNGNGQGAYSNVQGQLYGAQNEQHSYGSVSGSDAGGIYGPSAGQ